MKLPWDQIRKPDGSIDADAVQGNLDALAKGLSVFGADVQADIRFGIGSVTFTASTSSPPVDVPHGLGKTPVLVAAFEAVTHAGVIFPTYNYSTTTFRTNGGNPFGAITATVNFGWIAIG